MRIAIIDLGTNSVRFIACQLGPKRQVRVLHQEKYMIRLGQQVFINGKLDPDAIQRAVQVFSVFKKIANDLYVDKIVAIATSATREAVNGQKLLSTIRSLTGIEIRVISGFEEAKLIALGILKNENLKESPTALIDVGGGSTEISVCRNRKVIFSQSFPLGTARLQALFLKGNPPKSDDIKKLRRYIQSVIYAHRPKKKWPKVKEFIGSSGTIKALIKMEKKKNGNKNLYLDALKELIEKMAPMTTTELLGLSGMEAKRVDMMLAGAILIEEFMKVFKVDQVRPTDYSLRHGILEEQLELFRKHVSSPISFHLPILYAKAKRLGADERHLKKMVKLSQVLYKKLQPIHKLKKDWQIYLTAAVILRNVGESISVVNHEKHSFYIVKESHLPSIEPWELEFVAELCLYHELTKPDLSNFPYKDDQIKRQAFLKLLSLLLLVDALDDEVKSPVDIRYIVKYGRQIRMGIKGGASTELGVLRVQQKKDLFEKIFHKRLEVSRIG